MAEQGSRPMPWAGLHESTPHDVDTSQVMWIWVEMHSTPRPKGETMGRD